MLEFDEYNQLLVANPFADDSPGISSSNRHDTFITLTRSPSSEHHPLRSGPTSPTGGSNTSSIPSVSLTGGEGEVHPKQTSWPASPELSAKVTAEEDQTTAGEEAPPGGNSIIMHPVGPNDSFASVAVRYGVSIAALRRANQLWSSDPIYLRTELFIPRGVTLHSRHKPTHSAGRDKTQRPTAEPPPRLSPGFVVPSFVAARNMILSVLPARVSMESLSSKASTSEDHELDDFQKPRASHVDVAKTPFSEEGEGGGHELSTIAVPHSQYRRPNAPTASQPPYSPSDKLLANDRIPSAGDLRSRSILSPAASLEPLSRIQPFSTRPVRTSQLGPEPAMELPVRRSHVYEHHFWTDGAQYQVHSSKP